MQDILLTFAVGLAGASGVAAQAAGLPIVDLNMTIHQATLNVSFDDVTIRLQET